MRYALKEWSSVCDRLADGSACLLLRKGGILERGDTFELDHRSFLLFPTRHHDSGESPPDRVRFSLVAEAVRDIPVDDLERVRKLEGFHAVPRPDVEKRFHYRAPGIHAILVRVRRLARPVVLDNVAAYDGCVSWVELEKDVPVDGAEPVLSDREFRERVGRVEAILGRAERNA